MKSSISLLAKQGGSRCGTNHNVWQNFYNFVAIVIKPYLLSYFDWPDQWQNNLPEFLVSDDCILICAFGTLIFFSSFLSASPSWKVTLRHWLFYKCTGDNSHNTYYKNIFFLLKMAAFWYVALCSLVEVYRRFRGTYCLHQGPDDGSSKHLWNVG
jgi:hypothetical protein